MFYTLHRADSNLFIVNRDTIILEWAGKSGAHPPIICAVTILFTLISMILR